MKSAKEDKDFILGKNLESKNIDIDWSKV
jgi:hypothetical protein